MTTVKARFDGKVFVPCEPVDLPVGCEIDVLLPDPASELSDEEAKMYEVFRRRIEGPGPPFETLKEAMEFIKRRPYDPD